jgi:phage terminase large subunit
LVYSSENATFPNFSINRDKIKHIYASMDWGFTNPGVLQVWAVDEDERMYLIFEIYQTKKTIDWWVEKARLCKDHFGIEVFVCDPAQPSHIQQLRNNGVHAIAANNDIQIGIQRVQERLQVQADGLPRLFICADACIEYDRELYREYPGDLHPCSTEHEFPMYAWPESKDGKADKEVPIDLNNHGLDSLRYMVMHMTYTHSFEGFLTV